MNELHSLSALRQAADYLRAEEQHWLADTIMAAIETLTRDDDSATAIKRVREMHTPGAEWCNFHDSAFCYCAGVYCEACGDSYPCPTIQALDGSADPAPIDPVLDETDKRDRIDDEGDRWRWWGNAETWQFADDYIRGTLASIDRQFGPLRFANEDDEETGNE